MVLHSRESRSPPPFFNVGSLTRAFFFNLYLLAMQRLPMSTVWRLEFIWWLVTAIVSLLVLLPLRAYFATYPFLTINIIYIIVLITAARHIFLLPFSTIAYAQRFKVILFFICIPIVFLLVQELNAFQTYLDYNGENALLGQINVQPDVNITKYAYNEMLFFGVGSIISMVVLPFRLLISVWRGRNRNTV